jgi:hypothetical protein
VWRFGYIENTLYYLRNVLAYLITTLVSKTKLSRLILCNILDLIFFFFKQGVQYGELVLEFSFTVYVFGLMRLWCSSWHEIN